jgi:hypothetical protein
LYLHDKPFCARLMCDCDNLHAIELPKHYVTWVIINRIFGHKFCYMTIVPTKLLNDYRRIEKVTVQDEKLCTHLLKSRTDGQVMFMTLRKIHYNILLATMHKDNAQAFQGRISDVAAKHYTMYMQDELGTSYAEAWRRFGIDIKTLNQVYIKNIDLRSSPTIDLQ